MIRLPPRSTLTDTLFPTRRSSDLAVDQLKAMAGLRVVVLSGEGRAFCAGLDLSSLGNYRDPGASSAGRSEEHTSELQSIIRISYAVVCVKQKTRTRE